MKFFFFSLGMAVFLITAPSSFAEKFYTQEKHAEKFSEPYGMVQILSPMTYPVTVESMSFITHISETDGLGSKFYMRNLTLSESQMIQNGEYPYEHLLKDAPFYAASKKWRTKHITNMQMTKKMDVNGGDLASKYGVKPEDYPLIMYFAPSGNLYKFPTPAWRSAVVYNTFWDVVRREVNMKQNPRTSFWAEQAQEQIEYEKNPPKSIKDIDLEDLAFGYDKEERLRAIKPEKQTKFYTMGD